MERLIHTDLYWFMPQRRHIWGSDVKAESWRVNGSWAGVGSRADAKANKTKQKAAKSSWWHSYSYLRPRSVLCALHHSHLPEISIWLSLEYLKLIMSTTEVWIPLHTLVFFPDFLSSVNGFIFHSLLEQKLESSIDPSLCLTPQIPPNGQTCLFHHENISRIHPVTLLPSVWFEPPSSLT